MIPINWMKMTKADAAAMNTPITYVKWIIDIAIEAGYLNAIPSNEAEWGSIVGNLLDQTDLINYIQEKINAISFQVDGGFAASVYQLTELADGGGA